MPEDDGGRSLVPERDFRFSRGERIGYDGARGRQGERPFFVEPERMPLPFRRGHDIQLI